MSSTITAYVHAGDFSVMVGLAPVFWYDPTSAYSMGRPQHFRSTTIFADIIDKGVCATGQS
jgi:hypothetical protein